MDLLNSSSGNKKLTIRTLISPTPTSLRLTQIDCTSIPGWQNLKTENFYIVDVGLTTMGSAGQSGQVIRDYNAENGLLYIQTTNGGTYLSGTSTAVCVTLE